MQTNILTIRPYSMGDEKAVIELWRKCSLVRPVNNPRLDIKRKMKVNPELFLVGLIDNKIVASAMGGYEGHRGAVNYFAVDPQFQKQGLGRQLMAALEDGLISMGCPKINLMVLSGNVEAIKFYERIGFKRDDVVQYGKRLIEDKYKEMNV